MKAPDLQLIDQRYSFELSDLLVFLWQHKFRIVITAALMIAIGVYYILQLPKAYTASSTLLLNTGENQFALPSGIADLAGQDNSQLGTFMEFLRSRQFARELVVHLELDKLDEFLATDGDEIEGDRIEYAVTILQDNLRIAGVGDTNMVKVSFTTKSAEMATRIVNRVGPVFFEFYASMNQRKANEASVWLVSQLEQLDTEVKNAENQLQQFLTDNQLSDISSQVNFAQAEMSSVMTEKFRVDKQISELSSAVSRLEQLEGTPQKLLDIPWFFSNSLVTDLRIKIATQRQVLEQISKRYKQKHYRYIAEQTNLDALTTELEILLSQLSTSLREEFNRLLNRQSKLKQELNELKVEHSQLGKHEVQLLRLRRKVESTQHVYEQFLSKFQETEIVKDIGSNEEFAVVDYASIPKSPSHPRKRLLVAVTVVVSTMFSCVFWLVLHFVGDKRNRFLRLLSSMQVPVLAELPRLANPNRKRDKFPFADNKQRDYVYSESIRTLRTSLMLRGAGGSNRIIALTGIRQGDGKSTVSVSLAESFSSLEKTLLVDVDMRHPSIAHKFELLEDHPGVSSFISRRAKYSDCLFHDKDSRLTIMPSGPVPKDPIVYLSKPRFTSFIKKLGVIYERLIVEAPPVSDFSDALIVSKVVDGIVIVLDIEKTDSDDLVDAIQQLRDADAPLLGVVLNRVKNVRTRVHRKSRARRFLRGLIPG